MKTGFEASPHLREGFETVGIAWDANKSIAAGLEKLREKKAILNTEELGELDIGADEVVVPADEELNDWKQIMEVPERPAKKPQIVSFNPPDKLYWQRLIKKYGDNYKRMALDHELNLNQHTATICEKRCKAFLETYNDDLTRIVPFPTKEEKKAQKHASNPAAPQEEAPQPKKQASKTQSTTKASKSKPAQKQEASDDDDEIRSLSDSELSDISDLSEHSFSSDMDVSESSSEEALPPPKKSQVKKATKKQIPKLLPTKEAFRLAKRMKAKGE